MRIIPLTIGALLHFAVKAQAQSIEILNKICSLQTVEDDFYDPGLFPVQRSWSASKEAVEDNTIFFSASIAYTLDQIRDKMDLESKRIASQIVDRITPNYRNYQSRNDKPTFNFWQTVAPDLPFPNGSKLISNDKMRLPDDLDTSVIIALSSTEDSVKTLLRKKMVAYAGRAGRDQNRINTLAKFQSSEAYEVWFAKEMPQTFDICVLSNVLLFVFSEGFALEKYDQASIFLIKEILKQRDYLDRTDAVSHHTTSAAVILYHVARMVAADKRGIFDDLRPLLIADLASTAAKATDEVEKMLAYTSLLRLGIRPAKELDHKKLKSDLGDFVFFSVKPFLGNPQFAFLNSVVPNISWYCEAYNWTLYLEFLHFNHPDFSNLSTSR
ncbi:MAG: hypothetical protein AAF616_04325 [Bacteroidota bacterium]